jgi:hypothetical protein
MTPTTTSTPPCHRQRSSTSAKLNVIFNLIFLQLQYFSSIVLDFPCLRDLRRPALHVFPTLPVPPLDMLGGLALRICRSSDLRVHIFYLVLCSPLPRHARGIGLANLRVARPVGSNLLLSHAINSPLDMLGALAKANIWIVRPEG